MFRSGILVLTSPVQILQQKIPQILSVISTKIEETLYIHLIPGYQPVKSDTQPSHQHPVVVTTEVKEVVDNLYTLAASLCGNIDIRILLSNINSQSYRVAPQRLQRSYEVVLTDHNVNHHDSLLSYVTKNFPANCEPSILSLSDSDLLDGVSPPRKLARVSSCEPGDVLKVYKNIVLGGTFDKLHVGHKILLSEACLICDESILIGVTNKNMNKKKTLNELIEPVENRIESVREFLQDVKPTIAYGLEPISDPFGPSIVEPRLDCIVVSQETLKGGQAVNTKRVEKGLNELEIHVIDLVEDEGHSEEEEHKVSSSSMRARMLGTLYRQPQIKSELAERPYRIGITGGVASGKSTVCKTMAQCYNLPVIDCDKLGHKAYEIGSETLGKLVETFGKDILNGDGSVNRKALGGIVFSDKNKLDELNNLVWPAIKKLAEEEFEKYANEGHQVVLMEAAVLLEANWDSIVHEIWVSFVPQEEAIKRMINERRLSEEEAKKRVESQLSNEERIGKSNVVLCTLWEKSVTKKQIDRAWTQLQSRLSN